jgi:hypothetical protein
VRVSIGPQTDAVDIEMFRSALAAIAARIASREKAA